MNNDAIAKFCVLKNNPLQKSCKIDFKNRGSVYGFIVAANDYEDLKAKNFWRVVLNDHFQNWKATGNLAFTKIFNGSGFKKLSFAK